MSDPPSIQSMAPRATPRHVAFLLGLIMLLHQVAMATPAHAELMPMTDQTMQATAPVHGHCAGFCPLDTIVICPAVQAALPHTPAMLLLWFTVALIALALALPVPQASHRATPLHGWLWPPSRRRAFLQVFLC